MFAFVSCNHDGYRRFFFRKKNVLPSGADNADNVDDVDGYVNIIIILPDQQAGGSNDTNVVLVNA